MMRCTIWLALGGLMLSCSPPGAGGGGRCGSATDCERGQICLDGRCQDPGDAGPGADCSGPGDCGPGEACVGGSCQPSGPGDECSGDAECPGAQRCEAGRCVSGGPMVGPCGTPDPYCEPSGTGVGTEDPFDLDRNENDGVVLDDEGAIILDSRTVNTHFIWVAHSPMAQVVKIDTRTIEEVARYATAPDPSRTSVNLVGDVFVAARGGDAVTKISVLGADCPDTNGDGVITTSSGPGDVLPFGQDDCMLWHTPVGPDGLIRALAAQDIEGLDGELQHFVWVGGWQSQRIWKLDGDTGEILFETAAPGRPYGFALDGTGNLWISSNGTGHLGRVDTNRCVDAASCMEAPCVASSPESGECDGAVKALIPLPDGSTYGVTVDFDQRVWVGGNNVKRYDPSAAPGTRWATASTGWTGGLGADAMGFVYGAQYSLNAMVRIDANSLEVRSFPTNRNHGIGIDADGRVWGINWATGPVANILTPGPTIDENTMMVNVGPSLTSPYTYSDMTGQQLRLATNPRGHYRHFFEGCESGDAPEWQELRFTVDLPPGTEVLFRVRTAETREGLAAQSWILAATAPPDGSPIDLGALLTAEGIPHGQHLALEAVLRATRSSASEIITPRVLSMEVTRSCPPILN